MTLHPTFPLSRPRLPDGLASLPVVLLVYKISSEGIEPQWISSSVSDLLGYSEEDALYPGWWRSKIHDQDCDSAFAAYSSLSRTSRIEHYFRFRNCDGGFVWVCEEGRLLPNDQNGQPSVTSIWTIHQDPEVTRPRQTETHLIDQILEAIPNPLFFKDPSGRYLGCNRAFETYLGLDRDSIIGRTVYDISPPELADIYWAADEALFTTGGTQTYEASVQGIDVRRDVIFHKATFRKRDGVLGGLVGVIVDVTEQKCRERQWRVMHQTLNHISEATIIVDNNKHIVFANDQYAERTGYPINEVTGRDGYFLYWGAYDKPFYTKIWATVESLGRWSGEVYVGRKNGERAQEMITITEITSVIAAESTHFSIVFHSSNRRADTAVVVRNGKAILPNYSANRYAPEGDIIGASAPMQKVFSDIRKVAIVDSVVLITGESGTGKEKTAIAVHQCSPRSAHPFVAVNCGALPGSLIQSELFGHERGAFTGATQRRVGYIEAAAGGTVFLDEIGDLPLDVQGVLLRFLQEKTIARIGGTPIDIDVRVIAATNVNLERAVQEGRFREDLFYRLSVLTVELPPLRDRSEDIDLLADHFWEQFLRIKAIKVEGFSREARYAMGHHAWPGNVREMMNRIQRAMVMSDNTFISPQDLGLERRKIQASFLSQKAILEKQVVTNALKRSKGNISHAAKMMGTSRTQVYRLIKKHSVPLA